MTTNTRTVWRYPVPIDGLVHSLELPANGRIVAAAVKHGDPRTVHLWYEVDPDEGRTVRERFRIVGTGDPWSYDDWHRVRTVVSPEHDLVWHVLRGEPSL